MKGCSERVIVLVCYSSDSQRIEVYLYFLVTGWICLSAKTAHLFFIYLNLSLHCTNLDSIWKSRDITSPTKVHHVKAMGFPVVMYGCESWTIKKAERQTIDAFELWCWRRVLRVLWTARRSNQSILKEISPGCSWKDWCWSWNSNTWPPDVKSRLIAKDPDAGKDWGQEEKGTTEDEIVGWHTWLDGHGFGWTSGVGDGQGGLVCCSLWGHKELDRAEQLNWTVTTYNVHNSSNE